VIWTVQKDFEFSWYGIETTICLSRVLCFDRFHQVHLIIDDISDACEWKSIEELPEFMMDHRVIFIAHCETLKKQLNDKPLVTICAGKFTMPELQKIIKSS
jgi:hypothetical protein